MAEAPAAGPAAGPATPPDYFSGWAPIPAAAAAASRESGRRRATSSFSPPLIAMVAVLGTAFLVFFYSRVVAGNIRLLRDRWRRWRRRRAAPVVFSPSSSSSSDFDSPPPMFSPYGLDESAIKTLPLSVYSDLKRSGSGSATPAAIRDCAVCLLEFEDGESLRSLPACSHAFHAGCIDAWLRSQATCPLCRAGIFRQDSGPFVPMRASRIRPSLDDLLFFDASAPDPAIPEVAGGEIGPASPDRNGIGDGGARDFLLKRSYSFGFERNLAADRLVMEASTASPWRYHRNRGFWSKRWPSPFGGGGSSAGGSRAARVFSFRYYLGGGGSVIKSPFLRRRGFLPLSSERIGGPSSRRSRSMASPSTSSAAFFRPATFSSSRMRCGDPEALLSPERLNDRR